ncbi:DUF2523 domain-containing protein [Dyella dinghuensis]|uniref:DUF2523 domain-containing protein n=1 Tax=Dyella dinghuensis TaxID=1920169 RepID=A0A3S0RW17_9GAMM|nr:DUF2523 family protein [Dyella dinghuensis]RUL66815.1 DUF2523 domain-containing protein [Dyella dinghuensis]
MPVLIAWMGEMLLTIAGQIVLSALVALGINFVAQNVASGVIDHSQIASAIANSGAGQAIGWLGLDKAVTIILSAWAGRMIVSSSRAYFVKAKASS